MWMNFHFPQKLILKLFLPLMCSLKPDYKKIHNIFNSYTVFHMASYKIKWVLWLCFSSQTLFPSDLCWKHVYILIFGIISNFSMIWGIFHFFRKIKNLKNAPNHKIIEKFEKKNYYKIKMDTRFQHKSEGKWVWNQKLSHITHLLL